MSVLDKSSSPIARKKGLVKDEFYAPGNDVEPGSGFRIGVNDFDFIRVIGRGSYAKVMMVSILHVLECYVQLFP